MVKTRDSLIEKLIAYAGDDYDNSTHQRSFVGDCVDSAIDEVCHEMYPWDVDEEGMDVLRSHALNRYYWNIKRIAEFHYDKQGKEGVTTFYEAGQTTSFSGSGTPKEYFNGIVSLSRVI